MRVGVAHHFGWAAAVTAKGDFRVADRRRIELIEPGLPAAPIHHRDSSVLDDDSLSDLVGRVRESVRRASSEALDELATAVEEPIVSISLRAWPSDFPDEIALLRWPPYESRADSVMYRQVLAELGRERSWAVHFYDASTVEREAAQVLASRADEVLFGPRATLGPPWGKDQRTALAATIIASAAAIPVAALDAPR
jgi:hypothetical protein